MRVVVDERRLASRQRLARRLSFGGLVVLGAGLFVSLRAEPTRVYILLSYATLIAGTIASWSGVALMSRWVAPPRPEQVIPAAVGGMGAPWALYHWALPAEHVVVAPWGLLVLYPVNNAGAITIKGDRWRDGRSIVARMLSFGRQPLRDPSRVLGWQVDGLRAAVAEQEPTLADVSIETVAVFLHPRARLSVTEPSLPVVALAELKGWLRGHGKGRRMPPQDVRRLATVLDGLAAGDG